MSIIFSGSWLRIFVFGVVEESRRHAIALQEGAFYFFASHLTVACVDIYIHVRNRRREIYYGPRRHPRPAPLLSVIVDDRFVNPQWGLRRYILEKKLGVTAQKKLGRKTSFFGCLAIMVRCLEKQVFLVYQGFFVHLRS